MPATVTFVDIAGIVKGASEGEGLGNKFLAAIRESDAICQVVRVFTDPDVIHVDGRIAPGRRHRDHQHRARSWPTSRPSTAGWSSWPRSRASSPSWSRRCGPPSRPGRSSTAAGPSPRRSAAGEIDPALLADLHLLSAKPFIYVFNVDEGALGDEALRSELAALVAPAESVVVCAQIEAEVAALDPDDAAELLAGYGQEESGLVQLVHVGFRTLGLQTFLTAGPKESRAWTIHIGDTAPQAAGTIHTDFERGFIKAEIVGYDDLVEAGSLAAVRAAGKARVEGKEYVMRDGDVVEFRFNVS